MEFSQWLQSEMEKRDLTNYRISRLSGVHQTTIANLLAGAKPQIETERKIREAISRLDGEKEKAPAVSGERMSDDELKFALWGDSAEMDDADLDDVKRYAAFIRERKKGK